MRLPSFLSIILIVDAQLVVCLKESENRRPNKHLLLTAVHKTALNLVTRWAPPCTGIQLVCYIQHGVTSAGMHEGIRNRRPDKHLLLTTVHKTALNLVTRCSNSRIHLARTFSWFATYNTA
jgi:hypothetical protein